MRRPLSGSFVRGLPATAKRSRPTEAERAVRAALRMKAALAQFNREQRDAEMPELHVGFGIATGELVAGNVGGRRKVEYTVIGDPVNLAARLQELTPSLGADVLLSGETARRASAVCEVRSLGLVEIRGRAEPVEVFAADEAAATSRSRPAEGNPAPEAR